MSTVPRFWSAVKFQVTRSLEITGPDGAADVIAASPGPTRWSSTMHSLRMHGGGIAECRRCNKNARPSADDRALNASVSGF